MTTASDNIYVIAEQERKAHQEWWDGICKLAREVAPSEDYTYLYHFLGSDGQTWYAVYSREIDPPEGARRAFEKVEIAIGEQRPLKLDKPARKPVKKRGLKKMVKQAQSDSALG